MASVTKVTEKPGDVVRRKALSPDARENQLVALAMDVAEERMRNGTASSQEIVFYLKLGSSLTRLQKKELEAREKLARSKVKAIESSEEQMKLYSDAIEAMRSYSGK